ncbi:transcriptional repressor [bacterium]|nr:transcriptional repressor [bacterium]
MSIDSEEIARRLEWYKKGCIEAGVKLTFQRLVIMEELARSDGHPDAETVYLAAKQRIPMISQDTVYRTLWLLHDLNLIESLGSPQERVRFDANPDPHHHFVCSQCGATYDFYSDEFNHLNIPPAVSELGTVSVTKVEMRGLCKQCKIKNN